MTGEVRWLDRTMVEQLIASAAASPRRRKNLNFHPADDYPAHRLLNAIEPESYIAPHCHADPAKDETIVVLRGRLGAVVFDTTGIVLALAELAAGGQRFGIDIPHGVVHTMLALEPGTVFLEAKAGPYVPLTPAERAAFAPAEGSADAAAWLSALRARCFDR